MENMPAFVETLIEWVKPLTDTAMQWLVSPAAWSQFALLAVAFLMAIFLTRRLQPLWVKLLTPPEGSDGKIAQMRLLVLSLSPLLMPLTAYGLTAIGEEFTRSLFGSGAVIAFGKRVFMFIAVRALVRDALTDPFLILLGRYVLIPVAALYTLGALDPMMLRLSETMIELGNIRFSVLSLIRGVIAGSLLFWLGGWSNRQSAEYIQKQKELRPATRQLAVKAAEIAIFGAAFLLLMSIMGIDLTAIAVL
ncbi:MAG: mechanosensitive ion channel protein MscS, partial [Pseudorhodobacter sp.]